MTKYCIQVNTLFKHCGEKGESYIKSITYGDNPEYPLCRYTDNLSKVDLSGDFLTIRKIANKLITRKTRIYDRTIYKAKVIPLSGT